MPADELSHAVVMRWTLLGDVRIICKCPSCWVADATLRKADQAHAKLEAVITDSSAPCNHTLPGNINFHCKGPLPTEADTSNQAFAAIEIACNSTRTGSSGWHHTGCAPLSEFNDSQVPGRPQAGKNRGKIYWNSPRREPVVIPVVRQTQEPPLMHRPRVCVGRGGTGARLVASGARLIASGARLVARNCMPLS